MQFQIKFGLTGKRQVLPLNYQYPLSSWIYKVLEKGDAELSAFLHREGYRLENGKTFKLFTFSQLRFPAKTFRVIPRTDRLEIWAQQAWLTVAFQLPQPAEKFVLGLFNNQTVTIGDRISQVSLKVENIETKPEPEITGDNVCIRTLSPVVITRKNPEDKYETYLSPNDEAYGKLLFHNLLDKHKIVSNTFSGLDPFDENNGLKFECLTPRPKSRLQVIKAHSPKEVKVRGYLFDFRITAPAELIRTGINSGFGAMNAMGFGCGEIIKTKH